MTTTGYRVKYLLAAAVLLFPALASRAQEQTLRLAYHVFQDDNGGGNFNRDSLRDIQFLQAVVEWVNHKAGHLDTLFPAVSSPFVSEAGFRIRVDTVFYHRDTRAWDCSGDIDDAYMRARYVDQDSTLTYRMKHQILPVFIGGNHPVVGGHTRNIGDKGFIAVRGYYEQYRKMPLAEATEECARNLLHELAHCLGLSHNFQGGPDGDQCDLCEDNGCPLQGTSNNVMDYWPDYGHALSRCQVDIIQSYLRGEKGNISEVLVNDSCYSIPGSLRIIDRNQILQVTDTVYLHGDLIIQNGGSVRVSGYLSMPAGSTIQVDSDALLQITGGTVGNLCGDLWEGIRTFEGETGLPARILLSDGGTLENARVALMAAQSEGITLHGGCFLNNVQSLVVESTLFFHQEITDCSFATTRWLNHYEEGVVPLNHISMKSHGTLVIRDCSLFNEPGSYLFHPDSCGSGIRFEGDTLRVVRSRLENLTIGIDARGVGTISVNDSHLSHNRCAIWSQVSGYQHFRNNQFDLQRLNDVPTFGILLEQAGRFTVKGNRFESEHGGGNMTGLYLLNPSDANSLISDNQWTRIPIGCLVMPPPRIEENLFNWSSSESDETGYLQVGPQFRTNRYLETGIHLLLLPGLKLGTAIGENTEWPGRPGENSTGWPMGGYAWYNGRLPLIAARATDRETTTPDEHGLYGFMNSEWIEPVGDPDLQALRDLLISLQSAASDSAEITSWDAMRLLAWFETEPALSRSAIVAAILNEVKPENKEWMRTSLADISGKFMAGDSALVALGTRLASNGEDGPLPPVYGTGSNHEALPEFPDIIFFRFLPPVLHEPTEPPFDLYPNPAQSCMMILPDAGQPFSGSWRYEILALSGEKVGVGKITGWHDLTVDTSQLKDGLYLLRIWIDGKESGTRKFIKDAK